MSDNMQTIELTQPTRANESMVAQANAPSTQNSEQQSIETKDETRQPRLWMRGGGLCGKHHAMPFVLYHATIAN
ncbi:hypothetical protein MBLNU459_g7269t1 [Dothideomycetes sp. NU459]